MEKYFLKEAMVPDFFPPGLAKRILDVGKTVDFLRRICHVHEPFMDHLARAQPLVDLPMQSGLLRGAPVMVVQLLHARSPNASAVPTSF